MTTVNTFIVRRDGTAAPAIVSCHCTNGIGIQLTGLQPRSVKESILRVATALQSQGHRIPGKKLEITVTPVPEADKVAFRYAFDLPIALAIIGEAEERTPVKDLCACGGLGLDGKIYSEALSSMLPNKEGLISPANTESLREAVSKAFV